MRTKKGVLLSAVSGLTIICTSPALGQTTAPASPPADEPASAAGADQGDIVVTGYRRSLQSAQALKRDSDQIVDAVVAEDIGELPDNNASEAPARITICPDTAAGRRA